MSEEAAERPPEPEAAEAVADKEEVDTAVVEVGAPSKCSHSAATVDSPLQRALASHQHYTGSCSLSAAVYTALAATEICRKCMAML